MLYQGRCTMYHVRRTMYDLSLWVPDEFLIRGEECRTMRSIIGAAEQRLTRALIQAVELAGVENYDSNNRTPLGLRTRRGEPR